MHRQNDYNTHTADKRMTMQRQRRAEEKNVRATLIHKRNNLGNISAEML